MSKRGAQEIQERVGQLRSLAEKIVKRLRESTAPGSCSWGDEWQNVLGRSAHAELFDGDYQKDMVEDIVAVLAKELT